MLRLLLQIPLLVYLMVKSGAGYKLILQNDNYPILVIDNDLVGIDTNAPIENLSIGDSLITNSESVLIISRNRDGHAYSANRRLFLKYNDFHYTSIGDAGNKNVIGTYIYQFRIGYNTLNQDMTLTPDAYLQIITPDAYLQIVGSYQSSDQRLKKNIKTLDDCLYTVLNLRPAEYPRVKPDRRETGLIAQEVQHLIPRIVEDNEDGLKYLNDVG